jgi:hypothetical protein
MIQWAVVDANHTRGGVTAEWASECERVRDQKSTGAGGGGLSCLTLSARRPTLVEVGRA